MASKTLILDNGAYAEKVGYKTDKEPRLIPNCITKAKSERNRQFIGDQIEDCKDVSGLFYILPFQKGYLINWDVEKQVWDYTFGREACKVDYKDTSLIFTEPHFNFTSIQENTIEIMFEEYGFHSLFRSNAATLSHAHYQHLNPNEKATLIIDSGYSFTHLIPFIKGKPCRSAIKRINVGGKALTNHIKDIISYRQLHVMDETHVMNQVKEDACYVTCSFDQDMEIVKKRGSENTIVKDYVLPDYTVLKRGYIKQKGEKPKIENEQFIRMNNERFMVPELLFHPSDIGLQEMGISEAIIHTIECTPEAVQPHLYNNIVLTGGSCKFPGFKERIERDIRSFAPDIFDVRVTMPNNPTSYAWEGGQILANSSNFDDLLVTRFQYEEQGMTYCLEKAEI